MPQPSAGHASLMKLGIAQVESKFRPTSSRDLPLGDEWEVKEEITYLTSHGFLANGRWKVR